MSSTSTPEEDYPATVDGHPCAFCEGRRAAEQGDPETDNPYEPQSETATSSIYDSDHWLWNAGYALGDLGGDPAQSTSPAEERQDRPAGELSQ